VKRASSKKPRRAGPKETDIQSAILDALGAHQFEWHTDKNCVVKRRWLNIWLAQGQIWSRSNTGKMVAPSGAFLTFGVAGEADIRGTVRLAVDGPGQAVGLEVKRPKGKQSEVQKRWQGWFESAGGVYAVVESIEDARAVVARVLATMTKV
jgi:hypothetical protein